MNRYENPDKKHMNYQSTCKQLQCNKFQIYCVLVLEKQYQTDLNSDVLIGLPVVDRNALIELGVDIVPYYRSCDFFLLTEDNAIGIGN